VTETATPLPVSLTGVTQRFLQGEGERTVLDSLSLEAAAGEVVALLGPSGCGKSTLLRLVAGLDAPTSGTVSIGGEPIHGLNDRTAVAFQEPRLLPWRSLRQNVSLGLPKGTASAEGQARVDDLLTAVELADRADLRPKQVSGGMAQRASLARALARRPGVLLLDEPFGALDALTRLKMQDLLLQLHERYPATILLVTHDVDEALALADRILVLGVPGAGSHDSSLDEGSARTGSVVVHDVTVEEGRPRDRAGARHAELRAFLLGALGVDAHHTPIHHTPQHTEDPRP
jgi:sulfonate transport system ATP-binding protein